MYLSAPGLSCSSVRCLISSCCRRIFSCGRQRNSISDVTRRLWFLEGLNLGPLHLEAWGILATGPPDILHVSFYWTAPVASRFRISLPGNPRDIQRIKEGGHHFATEATWCSDKESSVGKAVVFNLHWASESSDHWASENHLITGHQNHLMSFRDTGCSVLCVPEPLTQVVCERAQYPVSQKLPTWSSRGARVENCCPQGSC